MRAEGREEEQKEGVRSWFNSRWWDSGGMDSSWSASLETEREVPQGMLKWI